MTAITILHALTPLHVGEGATVGAVDLPVARERHTRWPFVPGASLKGALRDRARWRGADGDAIAAAFGSEPGATPLTRGVIELGDAVLLALPVRCLNATWALLTCPLALERWARATGVEAPRLAPSTDGALFGTKLDPVSDRVVVLEDLPLAPHRHASVDVWADAIGARAGAEVEAHRLVVVHDDVFAFACRAWLPVRTRAAIDPDKGVVADGKLFTVEDLPVETLMWTWVRGGTANSPLPANGDVVALGGHRTTGAGRVAWRTGGAL